MSEAKVTFLIPGYTVAAMQGPDAIDKLQWLGEQVLMPWQAQLCHLLGLDTETGETLPAAQFSGFQRAADQAMVCAAPIHLKADRDTASLIPPQQLGLGASEADEIIASLNEFLSEDGIELLRDAQSGWFITGLDGLELKSFPPAFLAHRSATAFLPGGKSGGRWRRLMTEIQMLLHTHPVNTLRESQGKLPVNSLWFWGGALLPKPVMAAQSPGILHPTQVYAQDTFSISLCSYLGIACRALNEFNALSPEAANSVVIDTSLIDAWLAGDESGVRAARLAIDNQWIRPMVEQIEQSRLKQLDILTEDGQRALCNAGVLQQLASRHAAAHPPWWKRVLARLN